VSHAGTTDRAGGVTLRSVLLAYVILVVLTPLAFYVEIVWYRLPDVTSGVPAMAPVVVLLLLTALMTLPPLRRSGLTRRELLTIYSLVLVGGTVIGHGIFPIALSRNVAFHYMARTHPHWEHLFIEYVPTWFAPSDFGVVNGYFQGAPSVPWSAWWVALGALWLLIVLLFTASISLMVIFRRQWVTHERLSFPLAQIPLQMVDKSRGGGPERAGRLPLSWVFWLGVAISLGISFVNSLSQRVPSIPTIPLGPVPIVRWQRVGPWAGLGSVEAVLWPWMIAIAYLVPRELSFSVWFFWLVRLALHVLAVLNGATPQLPSEWYGPEFPAPYFQGGGAAFTLLALILWTSRRYVVQVVRIALGRQRAYDLAEEPIAYRWALAAFIISFAGLLYFCWLAGCRLAFGLLFMGILVAYFTLMARLRAEAGLGFLCYPIELQELLMGTIGSNAFRRAELVSLVSAHWSFQSGTGLSYEALPGTVMDSFKVADSGRLNSRRLLAAIVGVFLLALLAATYFTMTMMYRHGFMGFNRALSYTNFSWQTLNAGGRVANWLSDPGVGGRNTSGIAAFFAGGAVVVFLGMMRLRFWWWPFHPLGYIAANTWGAHWNYMPFFIGWALKSLVIRYGGLRLYRVTVPLAIGLIVGDMTNVGIWTVVALATHGEV
jgi:hypothetical protein